MLKELFGSKTRLQLLKLFFANPERRYHMRNLSRKLNIKVNAVRRELLNLQRIGLLGKKKMAGKIFFSLNKDFLLYPELESIIKKTTKAKSELEMEMKKLGEVKLVLLSGAFLKVKNAPLDLLLVGRINRERLKKLLKSLEKELGQEIKFSILEEKEFDNRRLCRDKFLLEVLAAPKQVLIDEIGLEKV